MGEATVKFIRLIRSESTDSHPWITSIMKFFSDWFWFIFLVGVLWEIYFVYEIQCLNDANKLRIQQLELEIDENQEVANRMQDLHEQILQLNAQQGAAVLPEFPEQLQPHGNQPEGQGGFLPDAPGGEA